MKAVAADAQKCALDVWALGCPRHTSRGNQERFDVFGHTTDEDEIQSTSKLVETSLKIVEGLRSTLNDNIFINSRRKFK